MRFTVGLPLMSHPIADAFMTADAIAVSARAAELAGFESVWVTEHPAPPDRWLEAGGHDSLDPFVVLGFAAAATTTLRLLTSLTVPAYRNPFLLAKSVATLDRLSGGRVTLGVGAGYLKGEFNALGVDFDDRNRLFDEALDVMRAAWSGSSVAVEGAGFTTRGTTSLPTPVQDPVPIWIGGNSRLTRRRVAAQAQGWMPMPNPAAQSQITRTAPIESTKDLAGMIREVNDLAAEAGRLEPIDIAFVPFGNTTAEDSSQDASHGSSRDSNQVASHEAMIDAVGELDDAGVTVIVTTVLAGDPAEYEEKVGAFGDAVIRGSAEQ